MMTAFLRGEKTTSKLALTQTRNAIIDAAIESGMTITADDVKAFRIPLDKYALAVLSKNLATARAIEEVGDFKPFLFFGARLHERATCFFEGQPAHVTAFEPFDRLDTPFIRLKVSEPEGRFRLVKLDHAQLAAYQKAAQTQLKQDIVAALEDLRAQHDRCATRVNEIQHEPFRKILHDELTHLVTQTTNWITDIKITRRGGYRVPDCTINIADQPDFGSLHSRLASRMAYFEKRFEEKLCDLAIEQLASLAIQHNAAAVQALIDDGFDPVTRPGIVDEAIERYLKQLTSSPA